MPTVDMKGNDMVLLEIRENKYIIFFSSKGPNLLNSIHRPLRTIVLKVV